VRVALTILFSLSYLLSIAQVDLDTCNIKPVAIAYFQRLTPRDSIEPHRIANAGKLYCSDINYTISRFIFTIDCESCDIVSRVVIGDTFSKEDLKYIFEMRRHSIIFFECIMAKGKEGRHILCKPFYFFSKP
jgi:hypothetical protein